ncbi:MFS transporter [Nonomuraea sp. B5E05]|uniref:MFS transporter n=1 Tax=Nonomuraea sp. B5E05 TaxID=3153569 RepID=UPI0032604C70
MPADLATTAPLTARAAAGRYALISFLAWLPAGLMGAPMVLLMLQRGMDVASVGLVMAIHSIAVVSLELPTGGLADVIGRRTTIAASAVFALASLLLMGLATGFGLFAIAFVLKAVSRALASGPAQAWYVDTMHTIDGPDANLKPGLARGASMSSIALCGGTLVGGIVPLALPSSWSFGPLVPLSVPMLLAAAAAAVQFVVTLVAMPEPPRRRASFAHVLRGVPIAITGGLRSGLRERAITRLLLVAGGVGVVLTSIEIFTPSRLQDLTGQPESAGMIYAVVGAIGYAGSALGSALAPLAARVARGSRRGAIIGTCVTAVSLSILAASTPLGGTLGIVLAGLGYVTLYLGCGISELLRGEMLHQRATSAERTTLLSVDSLLLQAGGAVAAAGLGWVAMHLGLATAWWITAATILATVVLFPRTKPSRRTPAPTAAPQAAPEPVGAQA